MKYLIVGSGITGTILAWKFYQKNIPFELWTDSQIPTASNVAAGLINPITGKRLAKIENYESVLQTALKTYYEMENFFGISLVKAHKIYRFLEDEELRYHYEQKKNLKEFQNYWSLKKNEQLYGLSVEGDFMVIEPAYRIRLFWIFNTIHEYFKKIGVFFYRSFFDNQEYKEFEKVFLCRGYKESEYELFPELKWENAMGEIIVFYSKGLQLQEIYQHQKLTIIPLGNDYYWLGATYLRETNWENYQPTYELENFLRAHLRVDYQIIHKHLGIRPILKERKPLLKVSTQNERYYLVNGMGSKGTLWAPYFVENNVLPLTENSF